MMERYRRLSWVSGDFSETFREDLFGDCDSMTKVPNVEDIQGPLLHYLHVI